MGKGLGYSECRRAVPPGTAAISPQFQGKFSSPHCTTGQTKMGEKGKGNDLEWSEHVNQWFQSRQFGLPPVSCYVSLEGQGHESLG